MITSLRSRAFEAVDAASLVFFRVAFGVIMLVEVSRFWRHDWIGRFYIEPDFLFKFYGFEWVVPLPGQGMYALFIGLGVAALCIALGLFFRLAAAFFLIGFTYVYLLEQAYYLNHLYLVIITNFVLCFLPANRYLALDAWLRPTLRRETVPRWSIWALMLLFEVVLLYAGLVKINGDWLRGQPLITWFGELSGAPFIGPLLTETWVAITASYGVIALHLIGAPLLLYRRTRLPAFGVYCLFHLANALMFKIGIFPWFTVAGTLMFFEPDWPRRFGRWVRNVYQGRGWRIDEAALGSGSQPRHAQDPTPSPGWRRYVLGATLAVFFAYHILFPLRHFLYPGNASWTEEGQRFAWRMMLRSKKPLTTTFYVHDGETGQRREVDPRDYLTPMQALRMPERPDMILQFAHHLAAVARAEWGMETPEVYAKIYIVMNGRRPSLQVDPDRDLAAVERNLWPADWILPAPPRRSQ